MMRTRKGETRKSSAFSGPLVKWGMSDPVPQPVCIANCRALLGEGPVWVARERALYWVDIKAPAIFRWREADGTIQRWTPPFRIGSLAPCLRGGFVGGTERGFARIDPERGLYEPFHQPELHLPDNRFNDGKVDRRGRFWAGTMDDRETHASGTLYRLDPDLGCTRIDEDYRVTNGPAFSLDGARLYHSDSARRTIYAFDLDPDGNVHGKRIFARFSPDHGYPDGMTVDSEDCLWIAFWDGWCIRRLSPEGRIIANVPMPVQRPTSCAFGAAALDRLFITSASIGIEEDAAAVQPFAGALFMVEPGVAGPPELQFG
jgi:xylono-1,5-lactonase